MHFSTLKRLLLLLLPFSILFASLDIASEPSSSGKYSVQVGAYRDVPEALLMRLETFGVVNTQRDTSITRVTVGSMNDWSEAKALLTELRDEGFTDAFIKTAASAISPSLSVSASSQSRPNDAKLEGLAPEDRPFAVYLDGEL